MTTHESDHFQNLKLLDTREAPRWVKENVTCEAQFLRNAPLAEPRYGAALIGSVFEAGLEVRP